MSIKKNLILNTMYQLLNIIVPLITSPYLSRTIGADGIGTYAYYNSIAYYFIIFIMLGLNNYGNRTIARTREKNSDLSRTFSSIYALQLIIGILVLCIYFIFAILLTDSDKVVAYVNIIYVASAIFDINWFFSGLEKFKILVFRNTVIKLLTFICILLFVKNADDLIIYVCIMSISTFISQISVWPFLIKEVQFIKPQLRDIICHLKPNLILFIPVIAVSLYKIMDKIMLGILSTKTQVGYYENSEKIINIPQALINSLGTVMLPRITYLLSQRQINKSKQYMRDSMQYAMFTSIGAAFGLIGISPNFTVWFFGREFSECSILISGLALTLVFNAWANVIRTQYLIPLNKDKSYIISVAFGAIVNLCINAMLINDLGAFGAVIGTFFAEFIVMFIQTIYVVKEVDVFRYIKDNFIFIISGIIMCIIVRSISNIDINSFFKIILQILIGVIMYALLSVLFLFFVDKTRISYIKENLSHRRLK